VIADPRAVADRWPEPRMRAIAELAAVTTETPWALSRAHRERAADAGLSDDDVVHAIALGSFFGHLNRIADAVEAPLDYRVRREPPHAEPATPPFLAAPAPAPVGGPAALSLERRPATAAALAAWMKHVSRPSAALDEYRRAMIATRVGRLLGDATGEAPPRDDVDRALLELADRVTLAPWKLDAATYAPLRAAGFDDRGVFDACVVASSAGVFSRIAVALAALAR
jgi:alkylhydroperoxidase family enzyme